MNFDKDNVKRLLSGEVLDFCIRLGLIVVAVIACERVFAPFLPIMSWALILAISLFPLMRMLRARTGWTAGSSATLLVMTLILVIGVPTVALGSSFATHIFDLIGDFDAQQTHIPPPDDSVMEWPIVGEQVYGLWNEASQNLPELLEQLQPQLRNFSKAALRTAASTAGTLFFFFGALIIAGIMMAYSESGTAAMGRIFRRVAGDRKGPELHRLTTLTVRSVATGVVGVAFIQSLILGVGFLLADIPAAGLLALVVLVVGILQLPALIVSLPAIAFVWMAGDGGFAVNIALTVYFIVGGFADNVLKPMLLGRGVDVPMPVVLLGALGGMIGAGIVGLFIGAVTLSVGYELFMGWVDRPEEPASTPPDETAAA